MRLCTLLFSLFIFLNSYAQDIDVQHYRFQLQLADETDKIFGKAQIAIKYLQTTQDISLNLVQEKNGKGMKVDSVKGGNVASFQQLNDRLHIRFKSTFSANLIDTLEIKYSGIPANGLIISKNKFGDRTFFSDNWPNRAHHWIPCNDVINDKASVEFIVIAPSYYQVISNGVQVEETNLSKAQKLTHWKETIPIPTKIMVIGVAQFAVANLDSSQEVPATGWVYPQNKQKGLYDYAIAPGIMEFFTLYIAPFPFQKLAHVQSTTIFGGMENASAIFYDENSVTGTRSSEGTVSHEIVHQWFGNMASEKSFAHLWLSEGFATYLTLIYWEQKYGKAAFQKKLAEDRVKVIAFARKNKNPVVDTISSFMDLLNENSYQKGAWVLHMLRGEVGDDAFHKIIQTYYARYKGGNADTRDFQAVAEKVSGKNLRVFFDQWLYKGGIPIIKIKWNYGAGKVQFRLEPSASNKFTFPLTLAFVDAKGKQELHKINISPNTSTFTLPASVKPSKIILDPDVELLFEGSITEMK